MNIIIRDLDQTRIHFEAAVRRVGERHATLAYSRALNHEGKKALTGVKRDLRKQTSVPTELINAGITFDRATRDNLTVTINGKGHHLGLHKFKAKQFNYGVRAKAWEGWKRYEGAFIIPAYSNRVFLRQGKKRFPLRQVWGPAIPVEMLRGQTKKGFEDRAVDVQKRMEHELAYIFRRR